MDTSLHENTQLQYLMYISWTHEHLADYIQVKICCDVYTGRFGRFG
jgi:hypothetical protein